MTTTVFFFLAKGAVFAALAIAVHMLVFRRGSAFHQSLYWRSAIVALLVVPLVAVFVPWLPVLNTAEVIPSATITEFDAAESASGMVGSGAPPSGVRSGEVPWVLLVWITGVIAVLSRWIIASIVVNRFLRAASPVENDVAISARIQLPLATGIFHPTVLLPKESAKWDVEKRATVLVHERTHLRRHDALFLLLSNIATAFHWPNPLVWIAARNLRLADERCADDSVLASYVDPNRYAELLLEFAKNPGGSLSSAVSAMAQPSTVRRRITYLLDPNQRRTFPKKRNWIAVTAVFLMAAATIGGITAKEASPDDFKQKLQSIKIPKLVFEDTSLQEVIATIQAKARELHHGKGVGFVVHDNVYSPEIVNRKISLNLTDVTLGEALKYVTQLSSTRYVITDYAIEIRDASSKEKVSTPNPITTTKLDMIVIPEINFRDIPVSKAIELLRQYSVTYDDPERPDERGVNFTIEANTKKDKKITLKLRDVTLRDAISYVSDLGGLKTRIGSNSVLFYEPILESEPKETRSK